MAASGVRDIPDARRKLEHELADCLWSVLVLADAYGVAGFRVTAKEDVVPTLAKARAIDGPVLIEFQVVDEENVYPMVPSGGSISEMLRRPREGRGISVDCARTQVRLDAGPFLGEQRPTDVGHSANANQPMEEPT